MKRRETSLLTTERRVFDRIMKVRKAASTAADSKRRFAEHSYLRSVLRAHRYFEDNNLLSTLMIVSPSLLLCPVRAGWHPLRVIIESSCIQPDLKTRSRWVRALEYAIARRIDPE